MKLKKMFHAVTQLIPNHADKEVSCTGASTIRIKEYVPCFYRLAIASTETTLTQRKSFYDVAGSSPGGLAWLSSSFPQTGNGNVCDGLHLGELRRGLGSGQLEAFPLDLGILDFRSEDKYTKIPK